MSRLLLIGLNHTTAPLAVRERVALAPDQLRGALAKLRQEFGGCEAVFLSTCNRVELYVASSRAATPSKDQITGFLSRLHGVASEEIESHLYLREDRAVVEHLFDVASSLDSMVLGESQILGQVRQCYETAGEAGVVGSMLNPLFQRAIAAGKEVLSNTSLGDGRLSVAGVAVEYARRIFETFADKTVLCIGAGKMATLALRHFVELRPGQLLVCNRDPARGAALAQRFAGRAVPFDAIDQQLALADVVISSTGSHQPIITRTLMEVVLRRRRYRPIFVIDIAVPRDVDPGVGELDAVYLYNIDDLQNAVSATQAQRSGAIDAARAIVARRVEEFIAWHRHRELGPTIDRLYKRYHALAHEEIQRVAGNMPNLSTAEREALDDAARRIVNKLLHGPVKAMNNPDSAHGISPPHLHALEKLFELGPSSPEAGPEGMPREHGALDE